MTGHALPRHHRSDYGEWEAFERAPLPTLQPYVKRLTGWVERTAFTRRREVPHAGAVVIINLDNRILVSDPLSPQVLRLYHAFFAGLASRHVVTETDGFGGGVQLDFTPIGAYLFTGIPASEFTNRVVHLEDVFGARAPALIEQLEAAGDWDTRLDIVEGFALERMALAPRVSEGVAWAWQEMERAGGNVRIEELGVALGRSPRELIADFRREIGLPPKQAARVLRFQKAVGMLEAPGRCLADVAFACGYYDQAHFAREFREFAGCTPTQHIRRLVPESGGVLEADELIAP